MPVLPQWNPANLTVAFGRLVRSLGIRTLKWHHYGTGQERSGC